ncbi:MAG TPA: hypothetical protein VEF05_17035, partial [Terriglobales bacterium]|nr:hypothetical protein [Terriglobales bacterium]
EMQAAEGHLSARDGAEDEFDPARQAHFALAAEGLHRGLATESLIDALLAAPESADLLSLTMTDSERNLLASILMKEDEELTPEGLEGATRALRRIQLRRKLEQVQRELQQQRSQDTRHLQALLEEKIRLKRALMDPGLLEPGSHPPAA